MSNTQTAMYYNGNWYGRSGNTDALDARITQTSNNIAPRQISDTASKLIAVGEYFTDKLGRLCVCDVQIASGGSIVVGSNCHVVSDGLGNELNSKPTVTSTYLISGQTIQIDLPSIYGTEKNVLLLFNHPYWSVPAMYLVCTGGDQVPAKIYDNNNTITFTRSGTTFNVTYTEPSPGWSRVLMTTLG